MNSKHISSCSLALPFNFPEPCFVNQRIAKVLFTENAPCTPGDRKTFQQDIEEIACSYVLNPEHINLQPYTDEEHDCTCLAVVEITLRTPRRAERIAELSHRAMPYPLLLLLAAEDGVMFSMAEKRFSRDGQDKVVLEQTVNTAWHPLENLTEFLQFADFKHFSKTSFRQLHTHYFQLLESLNCAVITGKLQTTGVDYEKRRHALARIQQLTEQIERLTAQARKELKLSVQIELNVQVKHLERHLAEFQKDLLATGKDL